MKSGFVILNYNAGGLSAKLAVKAAGMKEINQIVIVDNHSTDNSVNDLRQVGNEKIMVVASDKNGGYSYGNNLGVDAVRKSGGADVIFIANPDVDVEEADVHMILEAFQKTDYSVLTGIEFDINGRMSQPPVWSMNTYRDDLTGCFFLGRKLQKRKWPEVVNRNLSVQTIEIFKGSFLAVRMADFLDVGGFDENFFLFCEERVLSTRLKNAGKKIGLVTGAKYQHNHSTTINKTYKRKKQTQLLYESRLLYYRKYTDIGKGALFLLWLSMKLSLLEFAALDVIHVK